MKLDKKTRFQRDKILYSLKENNESFLKNKTLIVCDIQPEYQNFFSFSIYEFCEWVNNNYDKFNDVVFLYNGNNTLGMIHEHDLKMYYIDNGISEDIITEATFYDKGYGYMRDCIDAGVYEDDMVLIGKYMLENKYHSIKQIKDNEWALLEKQGDYDDIDFLKERSKYNFSFEMITEGVQSYDNIVLVGGGSDECLKEVELALLILDKNFTFITKYVY